MNAIRKPQLRVFVLVFLSLWSYIVFKKHFLGKKQIKEMTPMLILPVWFIAVFYRIWTVFTPQGKSDVPRVPCCFFVDISGHFPRRKNLCYPELASASYSCLPSVLEAIAMYWADSLRRPSRFQYFHWEPPLELWWYLGESWSYWKVLIIFKGIECFLFYVFHY